MEGTEEESSPIPSTAENIQKIIKELKVFISVEYEDFHPFKILENIGDYSYVIKFNQFLDKTIILTVQIPSKY